jgi:hypothetical protein
MAICRLGEKDALTGNCYSQEPSQSAQKILPIRKTSTPAAGGSAHFFLAAGVNGDSPIFVDHRCATVPSRTRMGVYMCATRKSAKANKNQWKAQRGAGVPARTFRRIHQPIPFPPLSSTIAHLHNGTVAGYTLNHRTVTSRQS